ncbi:MAG: hypothetical protein NT151_11850 [Acidobacteria bacterium]|nr:hypothetical protein [Acidobacteriota bacterium]
MRDTTRADFTRRVVGRWALERSIRLLLRRVERFGTHRARDRADLDWALRVSTALDALLPPRPPAGPRETRS